MRISGHMVRLSATVTYTIVYDDRENTFFVGNLLIDLRAFSFKSHDLPSN